GRDVDVVHRTAAVVGTEGHGALRLVQERRFGTGSAHARAGGEEVVQVVSERVELGDRGAVDLAEEVEGEHGRDRDEQADRGHDQRLAHRAGDGVDRGRTGRTDLDQGAVDAPHGTQQ